MKIWNVAIKQPVFMIMILLAGVVMGIIAFRNMAVNLFPDIEFPVVVVSTVYPGASPEEVEEQVTSRIEKEMSTISGLDTLSSTSSEGVSTVIMQFDLDLSVDKVSQDVRDKVNLLSNQLPTDVQTPIIQTFDPNDLPIISFSVADQSGELSPLELRQLVEDEIQAPLESIPNVSAADVSGGDVREIQVNLDTQALQSLRISPQQVTGAIQAANINLPGGSIDNGTTEFLIRTPANLQTLADVRNIIITERSAPIYLRDVATVVDGFEKNNAITRLNGEDAIVLGVRKTSGSNTATVAESVKEELIHLGEVFPNLEIVVTSDQSIQVEEATGGAIEDLLYAAILAALVMFFFFRDLRNTFVTLAGLPVIMVSTLFFMNLFGISLNQISLLALALVVGLVIDDGIVVRENIIRWKESGFSPRVAASLGTAEVALPVLAIGATIIAVFLPVAFAEGIIGKFFLDFGLTVSIAMAISVFEALTMAPMLSAYVFKKKATDIDAELDELDEKSFKIADELEEAHEDTWLNRNYGRILNWTLTHKVATGLVAIVIVVASFASVAFIDLAFVASLEGDEFTVSMALPGGTPLNVTDMEATQVENILHAHPLVENVVTNVGGQGSPEAASFSVSLYKERPEEATAAAVIDELRAPLAAVPGILFAGGDTGFGAVGGDITLEVVGIDGTDFNEMGAYATGVAADLALAVPGLSDFNVSYKEGRPELQINVDRQRASDLGLSTAQIASTVRLLVNGDVVSTFRGEGAESDMRVQLAENERGSAEDILNISVQSATGQLVPLRSVATISEAVSPNAISRTDGQPVITIGANVVGGLTVPDATAMVTEFVSGVEEPANMTVQLGGTVEDQAEAFGSLFAALGLGVLFVYMVLASQFGSFIQPLLIMLAMPLAIAGAIVGLLIAGFPLDITAMIGFIMLMGLVVKNSVLLVDFANRGHKQGMTADEAMIAAGPVRLRPILMTSLSMILAMTPIALGLSAGGEFRQPMAVAIMGGMISSTLLTLFIIPLAYSVVINFQDRMKARRVQRQEAKRQAEREQAGLEGASTQQQLAG